MALIVIPNVFTVGAVIVASQHNSNFSIIYSDYNGNVDNTNLSASAGIVDTKLAQITTAGKVSGAALTTLSSTPAGAGLIPVANIDTGTTANKIVILTSGTTVPAKLPAVDGSLLTALPALFTAISVLDYGTSTSASTQRGVAGSTLKMCYGTTTQSGGSITISNLPFSGTTYIVVGNREASGTGAYQSQALETVAKSSSSFQLYDNLGGTKVTGWIAFGV